MIYEGLELEKERLYMAGLHTVNPLWEGPSLLQGNYKSLSCTWMELYKSVVLKVCAAAPWGTSEPKGHHGTVIRYLKIFKGLHSEGTVKK